MVPLAAWQQHVPECGHYRTDSMLRMWFGTTNRFVAIPVVCLLVNQQVDLRAIALQSA